MAITYLDVAFKEKDKVKSLGARWDQNERKWFVPEGHDLSLFTAWLPADVSEIIYQQPLPLDQQENTASSLSQLLSRIAQVVPQVTPKAEWVKAEISEYRVTKNGHIHIDLAEFDANKNLLCKAPAKLFKAGATTIINKFSAATGASLAHGMKVLMLVKAQFHIQYGFSLSIEDIDPSYTLGDIAAKLTQIRNTLQHEGIFESNKKLPSPKEFCKIAVISPKAAAGLGDFKREADFLEQFTLCQFHYYDAQFQGDAASNEIAAALAKAIADHHTHHFDALVIIRGGGATIDLAWLNDLTIARHICLAPLPVFSGIGHERDNTIIDEVVNKRFDTPSKVIAHIFNTIVYNAKEASNTLHYIFMQLQHIITHQNKKVHDCHQQIILHVKQAEKLTQQQLQSFYQNIVHSAQHQFQLGEVQTKNLYQLIANNTQDQLKDSAKNLEQTLQSIHTALPRELESAKAKTEQALQSISAISQSQLNAIAQQTQSYIELIYDKTSSTCYHYQKEIEKLLLHLVSLGPQDTLKRGFALITDADNNIITSLQQAKEKTHLSIEFHDGKLSVKHNE